jgi:hypothetical protein
MRRTAILTLALFAVAAVPASSVPVITRVMSGLDNPRGLAFGPEGALYVVEAGRGGPRPPSVDSLCVSHRGAEQCYGATGALTRLWRGVQERVATGLPSYANPAGEATGAHDVSFQGRGGAYVTVGWAGNPALRNALFPVVGERFGTLVHVPASGNWRVIADIAAHEETANPDGDDLDSNPYGILANPGTRIVTDAGANALLQVDADGSISTLAAFPPVSVPAPFTRADAVPTAVVVGPDGAYYVSELTGVPFAAGAAQVMRVVPGEPPQVYLSGFKTLIDLAFSPDGSLYVLQHATGAMFFGGPGQVIRIAPNGTRSVIVEGLTRPSSIAIGSDGAIYVSNFGTSVGGGEVLRITL